MKPIIINKEDFTGPIIGVYNGRHETHCYAPSHMYDEGVHRLWFCNWDMEAEIMTDAIFYTEKRGSLFDPEGWSLPVQVHNKFNHTWVLNHTADPTVLKGRFLGPDGHYYSYLLHFTADNGDGTMGNTVGASLSDDGIHWVPAHDGPVIWSDKPANGVRYEYGMNSLNRDPITGRYISVALDSEREAHLTFRSSPDGINWRMDLPSLRLDGLSNPLPDGDKQLIVTRNQGPDIAYNPADKRWWAVCKCTNQVEKIYDGKSVLMRAKEENQLNCDWEVLAEIDNTVTGQRANHNPAISKNSDGTLYTDEEGYCYVFFGMGASHLDVEMHIGAFRYHVK